MVGELIPSYEPLLTINNLTIAFPMSNRHQGHRPTAGSGLLRHFEELLGELGDLQQELLLLRQEDLPEPSSHGFTMGFTGGLTCG